MCLAKRGRTRQTCCSLSKMKTIFISIAAYNDPQLIDTIKSALYNARKPERITFGVALQYYEEPDLSEFSNVRTISYHPDTRPGIVKVRYNISKELYQGEDFYLQLDSHYQFAPGWDSTLIKAYKEISGRYRTDKVAILPLEPYEDGIMTSSWDMVLEDYPVNDYSIVHPKPINGKSKSYSEYHEIYFARAGQMLFPKSFIELVGLDPYSQTSLEIFMISFRLLMSGYRVFQLNKKITWQADQQYQLTNWKGVEDKQNRFKSAAVTEHPATWHELSLAIIYNDYSKYAIKDAEMTPEEFWSLQGQEDKDISARNYYNNIIYNKSL